MKKIYILLWVCILLIGIISAGCSSPAFTESQCSANGMYYCTQADCWCVPTSGFCTNLFLSPTDAHCSLEKGSIGWPKSCCSTAGYIIDYSYSSGSYHCCSPSYPYYSASDSRCYNVQQPDSDNYFTRLSECVRGGDKCEGQNYYRCVETSVQWVFRYQSVGITAGQCGIECTSSSNCNADYACSNYKCIEASRTFYRLENKICNSISILPSQKTANDYNTLEECQNKITTVYYRLESNQCYTVSLTFSEKTVNDYNTLAECQNKIVSTSNQTLTYYRLQNNQCISIQLLQSQKTIDDYSTLSECQNKIVSTSKQTLTYYRLENNRCSPTILLPSQKTASDYTTLQGCESNIEQAKINYTPFFVIVIIILSLVILIEIIFYITVVKRRKTNKNRKHKY